MTKVLARLGTAEKDVRGACLEVPRLIQTEMKQKADILARRPLRVERVLLHGLPLGQARRRNNPRRIMAADRTIDRVGREPVAMVLLEYTRIGAAENFDHPILGTMGNASQAAIKSPPQSV